MVECENLRLHDDTSDLVRIGVGSRATILKVPEALSGAFPGNTDGGTTVGNAIRELVDSTSFVSAGETLLVVLAVDSDVLGVPCAELLDGSLDELHAALCAHVLGGEVGVEAGTVPVARDGLRVDRHLGAELLSDAVEQESSEPEVVTHLNAEARANLELPLSGHNLGVDARDVNTRVEAGTVVGLNDITLNDLTGTNTAVVWALRSGEAILGPIESFVRGMFPCWSKREKPTSRMGDR